MDGALYPKTSLLIKLAKIADHARNVLLLEDAADEDVTEWLDRMAELRFIRQPYMSETKPPEETL